MSSTKDIANKAVRLNKVLTSVLTYVFKPSANLEKFLSFIKEKAPKALVSVLTDDKGYQNVTITTTTNTNIATTDAEYVEKNGYEYVIT